MTKPTDIRVKNATLYFIPVVTRIPLKFGPETCTSVTLARVKLEVEGRNGHTAVGWGETPLSVQWVWVSSLPYEDRHNELKRFARMLAKSWSEYDEFGHPMEVGHGYQEDILPKLLDEMNASRGEDTEQMPWLAALVCCSAFDLALHDAYGVLLNTSIYNTYTSEYMNKDLSEFISPAEDRSDISFSGKYPGDMLTFPRPNVIPVWHLIGGKDLLEADEATGEEPDDGYPFLLRDWIDRDGLNNLKVKLRGNDPEWDYDRLTKIGAIALEKDVDWLCADFNCTVKDPDYVNAILDKLIVEYPKVYQKILYIEQPFPYDLEKNRIIVHSISSKKPLFMDESAHDWKIVRLGRSLGWTGVALKTCKTQTGALLSQAWAKTHGLMLMVQDLSNPALATIPHVQLAAHAGTIMGVESNGMQFYPAASAPEEAVHPGLYKRRNGTLDLSSIKGPGFGYRLDEITRELPEPESI